MVKFKCSISLDDGRKTLRKSENAVIGIEKKNQNVNLFVKFNERFFDVYPIKDRFDQVHKKFINQGKLTVVFNSPRRNILIQGKTPHLKRLLHEIAKEVTGMERDIMTEEQLRELEVCCNNTDEIHQKKMKITSMEHYNKIRKKIPSSLELLEINNIGLATVNMQWFSLNNLKVLHLSGNSFDKLNHIDWKIFFNIKKLINLTHLDLSNCKLKELPVKFVRNIPRQLKYLDLQGNHLSTVPEELSDLYHLNYLSVALNKELESLPNDLFFNCTKLMIFKCSDTKINYHPAVLRNFKFQLFSSSALGHQFQQLTSTKLKVPSLLSICSAKVYDVFCKNADHSKQRILYLLPSVIQPLLNASTYRCDRCRLRYPKDYVGQAIIQPIPVRWIAEYVEQEENGGNTLPLLDMICKTCYRRDERILTL